MPARGADAGGRVSHALFLRGVTRSLVLVMVGGSWTSKPQEKPAQDFSLATAQGEQISLEGLRGRVVLLDFWATWCEPCVEALPSLDRLNSRYANGRLAIVSISEDRDDRAWRSFIDSRRPAWRQCLDKDGRLKRLYRIHFYPTYILIDPKGRIVFRSGLFRRGNLDREVAKVLRDQASSK